MPCLSNVCAFHFGLPISSMPTRRAELLGELGEHAVPFPQDQVARLFGRGLIDANPAPPHFVNHRQQINFEAVGVSRSFAIEDRIEVFKQRERARGIDFGIWSDKARRQLPDVRLGVDLLALRRKPRGLDGLLQQRRIFAREAAPGTERVETVGEAVLVNESCKRADLLQPLGRRHLDAGFGAQPAPVVETVLGDEAHVGRDQIPQPAVDLRGIEIVGVGVAQRDVNARG